MTVAVGGIVQRIWEVHSWAKDQAGGKWVADLGRELSNFDLDAEYPNYPFRIGDACPTKMGGAYRPYVY